MAFVIAGSVDWHEGEEKMHSLMRVPRDDNPVAPSLTPGAAYLLHHSPLLALGTLDSQGRPWTTVWGGQPGFAGPVNSGSVIGIRHVVDKVYDPVVEALLGGKTAGEVVKEEGEGKLISGLPIDLERRKRAKLSGKLMAASLEKMDDTDEKESSSGSIGHAQVIAKVTESLGKTSKSSLITGWMNRRLT